jgi:FkbM family methyltransferase
MDKLRAIKRIILPKKEDPSVLAGIERAKPWFEANGDKTLRLDYPMLSPKSVVFDLGGFEGQWASDIYSRYLSSIYVFEPVQEYFDQINSRFAKNKAIRAYPFALSAKKTKVKLFMNGDKTSQFLETEEGDFATMRVESFIDFCASNNITNIDLMKINIEGGEYDLLESIIAANWQTHVANFQIQFHNYTPDAEERMHKIQAALKKTHRPTYQFNFVWENWELK